MTLAKKVEIMQITAALLSPLPPLLCNSPKHCLMAHGWCTFLLCCAHVFQAGVQTSNSCRDKGACQPQQARGFWKSSATKTNIPPCLVTDPPCVALANKALWQHSPFLCHSCAPVLLDSHGAITDSPPALLSGCLQWKVGVWSLPLLAFFLSPSKTTKQSWL